jgi:hypothetical protein
MKTPPPRQVLAVGAAVAGFYLASTLSGALVEDEPAEAPAPVSDELPEYEGQIDPAPAGPDQGPSGNTFLGRGPESPPGHQPVSAASRDEPG